MGEQNWILFPEVYDQMRLDITNYELSKGATVYGVVLHQLSPRSIFFNYLPSLFYSVIATQIN